jgi:hypothetical protein
MMSSFQVPLVSMSIILNAVIGGHACMLDLAMDGQELARANQSRLAYQQSCSQGKVR